MACEGKGERETKEKKNLNDAYHLHGFFLMSPPLFLHCNYDTQYFEYLATLLSTISIVTHCLKPMRLYLFDFTAYLSERNSLGSFLLRTSVCVCVSEELPGAGSDTLMADYLPGINIKPGCPAPTYSLY